MRYRLLLLLLTLASVLLVAGPGNAAGEADERRVVLHATHNTRELGGLPLSGRTRFRKAMVYRSGALCYLTPNDVKQVEGLKIETILDFRTARELAKEGLDRQPLRESVPHCVALPMGNSQGLGRSAYYYLMRENDAALLALFQTFARPQSYPILYHCSAGKDRTGIVTALLLELLGATRDTIMDDYLQSQRNSVRLVVQPDWLQEVFKVVDAAGGIEAYLKHLGVTPAEIDSIRKVLTENPFPPLKGGHL